MKFLGSWTSSNCPKQLQMSRNSLWQCKRWVFNKYFHLKKNFPQLFSLALLSLNGQLWAQNRPPRRAFATFPKNISNAVILLMDCVIQGYSLFETCFPVAPSNPLLNRDLLTTQVAGLLVIVLTCWQRNCEINKWIKLFLVEQHNYLGQSRLGRGCI